MGIELFGTSWSLPSWWGSEEKNSQPSETSTESTIDASESSSVQPQASGALCLPADVSQCGPGSPFSANYADSFSQAWYDPASDSVYASYDGPGVTVRYPLSSIQSEPCGAESDAYAMATARDQDGVFVPGVLNAHTTPRLAKLAGEVRDWKESWANADAITRASLELLPIVTAYGGQGMAKAPAGGSKASPISSRSVRILSETVASSRAVSPSIEAIDLVGKTRTQIRRMAKERGLVPHATKPDKWLDPVTGKERLRIDAGHIDKQTGLPYNDPKAASPHVHAYEPNGKTKIRDPFDNNPHFPVRSEP
jgi:hypothetical protein